MNRRFFARLLVALGLGAALEPSPGRAASSMNLERASEIVAELAECLVKLMEEVDPNWTEVFWRFEIEETRNTSSGSYVTPSGVERSHTIRRRRPCCS